MTTPAIFISYRREDAADVTGRIYDRLVDHFGRDAVFKDVDSLPLGVEFAPYVQQQLERCSVVLAIIGRRWRGPLTEGRARLDDADDWVRIEIETALRLGLRVVPVLVHGAPLPEVSQLPASLAPLRGRQAARIEQDPLFHDGVDRLIRGIARLAPPSERMPVGTSPQDGGRRQPSAFLVALRNRLVEALPERWEHGRGTRSFISRSVSFREAVRAAMGEEAGALSLVFWCDAPENTRTRLSFEVFEAPRGWSNASARLLRRALKDSLAAALESMPLGVPSDGFNIARGLPLDTASEAGALRDAARFAVEVDGRVESWIVSALPDVLPAALAAARGAR